VNERERVAYERAIGSMRNGRLYRMSSNGGACFSESEVAWPTGAAKRRSFREHYK
jgi:hypothetical protein